MKTTQLVRETRCPPLSASVVICVYNRGSQVLDCLQSLLESTVTAFEIVIVDDASSDNTPDMLATFKSDNPQRQISIVRNANNLGVSGARNVGIDACSGRYVFYTDSDCTVSADWLEKMITAFSDDTVDAVAGGVINVSPTNYAERALYGTHRIQQSATSTRHLIGGNMGFKRDVVAYYRFDEALTYGCDEDDIARRLLRDGRQIQFVPDALVFHNHPMTLWTYLKHGYAQGVGASRYYYKWDRYIGRDLVCIALAVFTLPLAFVDKRLALVPLFCVVLQLCALLYNEAILKGKGLLESILLLPLSVLYYASKSWGAFLTLGKILLGMEPKILESKRQFLTNLTSKRAD